MVITMEDKEFLDCDDEKISAHAEIHELSEKSLKEAEALNEKIKQLIAEGKDVSELEKQLSGILNAEEIFD